MLDGMKYLAGCRVSGLQLGVLGILTVWDLNEGLGFRGT